MKIEIIRGVNMPSEIAITPAFSLDTLSRFRATKGDVYLKLPSIEKKLVSIGSKLSFLDGIGS